LAIREKPFDAGQGGPGGIGTTFGFHCAIRAHRGEVNMTNMLATVSIATAMIGLTWACAQAQEAVMPAKCKDVASQMNMPMSKMMDMPMDQMMKHMHGMQLGEVNKEFMEGMRKTMPAMMQGMMMEDADTAFVCGMIAHHMGAIEMSKAELKFGDNKEAKQMAQQIIDAQLKEIEEMTKWVEVNVK
jgi:uncharacterized protein (DUF305 family)